MNFLSTSPHTKNLRFFPLAALLAVVLFTGCGGGKKSGSVSTAVTSINVSATLNAPAAGFRHGRAFADWRVLAYATDATTKTGTLAETSPGSGVASLSLTLDYGRIYRILLVKNNAIYATIGYPYTSGSGTLTTTTLPLNGTITDNNFAFGALTLPNTAGGTLAVSAGNNPLTKIKASNGQTYDVATNSPAVDATLVASLNTIFTSTVATAAGLPGNVLPSSGDVSGSSTATCNLTAGTLTSLSPSAAAPGATVTLTGTGLPTSGAYVGLLSSATPVTGLGGANTVSAKTAACADLAFSGAVALTGSSSSLSFTVPTGATVGTTGTLVMFTSGNVYLSSNTTFTVTASSSTPPSSDTTAPTIVSVSPTAGGTVDPGLTTASVTFSEAMTATTTPDVTVTLLNPSTGAQTTVLNGVASTGTGGLGTVAWSNNNTTLTFTLTDTRRLLGGTSYQLRLTFGTGANGLKDAAGNSLSLTGVTSLGTGITQSGQSVTYTFNTSLDTLNSAPRVSAVSPANGSTVTATSTTGTITFTKAMDTTLTPVTTLSLINEATGTVLSGVSSASLGTAAWTSNTTLTFTLTDARRLTAGQTYSYVLTLDLNTLKDTTGLPLDLTNSAPNLSGVNVLSSNILAGSFTTN